MKYVVTAEEERQSRSIWRVRIIDELLLVKDGQIRGAKVRILKPSSILRRPVNKLYLVERIKDTVTEGINITDGRSRRDKENFIHKTYVDIFSWTGVFEINVCLENKVAVSNPDDISISSSTDVGLTRISPCNQITFQLHYITLHYIT